MCMWDFRGGVQKFNTAKLKSAGFRVVGKNQLTKVAEKNPEQTDWSYLRLHLCFSSIFELYIPVEIQQELHQEFYSSK